MTSLRSKYDRLVSVPFEIFQQNPNGDLVDSEDLWWQGRSRLTFNLYPGSFNPLHEGHKGIYSIMPGNPGKDKVFEISITRYKKPNLSFEELQERLSQFKGYAPILVTNTATFLGKCTVLRKMASQLRFHVGMDTILRVREHYGEIDMMAIPAYFEVYDRKTADGTLEQFPDGFRIFPKNAKRATSQLPEALQDVSSTKIRNNIKQ